MRRITYSHTAQKQLTGSAEMDCACSKRFNATGEGDVKPMQGEYYGLLRLRVGRWRAFIDPRAPGILCVVSIENRGQAY